MFTELKEKSSFHDKKLSSWCMETFKANFFFPFSFSFFCLFVQNTVSSTQFSIVGSVIFPDAKKEERSKRKAGD